MVDQAASGEFTLGLSEPTATAPPAPAKPAPITGVAWWSVALLTAAAFLAGVDRQSMANLLVPIQKEFHMPDWAMGLLTGSAFSLVYAFVAIPMAMLADRVNRKRLINVAVAFWSGMTVMCGFARSYAPLLLARLGVGAGEAAVLPSAMSTIGDLAPPASRGTPIGIYTAGAGSGLACGGLFAGVMNDHFGWHVAVMAVGAPGLILATVMLLTMREPVRGARDGLAAPPPRESLLNGLRRCLAIPTFRPFAVGYFCLNICYVGWLVWMPAFLIRAHHLTTTQSGLVMLGITVIGALSTLIAGPISDRLARRAPRWRLYYGATAGVVAVPFLAAATLAQTMPATLGFLFAYTIVSGGLTAISYATFLSLAPVNMRGLVTAVMNILGLGLGGGLAPVILGGLNDVLKRTYGDQSLHYTLLVAPAAMGVTVVMYLIASRTMDRDVRKVSEG